MRVQDWTTNGAAAEFDFAPGGLVPTGLQFRPHTVSNTLLADQTCRGALWLPLGISPLLQRSALALAYIYVRRLKPRPRLPDKSAVPGGVHMRLRMGQCAAICAAVLPRVAAAPGVGIPAASLAAAVLEQADVL